MYLYNMDISRLTRGQKEALLESLIKQKAIKTPAERRTLETLRLEFSEEVETEEGFAVLRSGDYVKMKHQDFDTFGEDYRNNWIKIRETSKGEYFLSYYLSGTGTAKRIYLKV